MKRWREKGRRKERGEGKIIRNDETAAEWRRRQKCTVSKSPRDCTLEPLGYTGLPVSQI